MKYRNIPDTNLTPSVLCLGCGPFGSDLDERASLALLDSFFEGGGNFIDTALVYGEWLPGGKGLSEKTIGKWLKARGNREQVIISTKGAHPRLNTMNVQRLAPEEIVSDLDESLQNLGTETIDLYWLHRDDPNRPVAAILKTLNKQVKAGKIRYFGCSNWRLERLKEAQHYAAENGLQPFSANQVMWSLATPNPEAFLFDPNMVGMDELLRNYHQKNNLAVLAYTSQARGFFTRLAKRGSEGLPHNLKKNYINEENLEKMFRLKVVSKETGYHMGEIVLSYLLSQPFPTFPIAGSSNLIQLKENMGATDKYLEPALLKFLEG